MKFYCVFHPYFLKSDLWGLRYGAKGWGGGDLSAGADLQNRLPPPLSSVSQPPEVGFQKVRVENALEFHDLAHGANRFVRAILWKEGPRFYFENLQKC